MKFRLQDRNGNDVLGGEVSEDNAYIKTYGKLIKGSPPEKLDVGDACVKEYALSGQKATQYYVIRTE